MAREFLANGNYLIKTSSAAWTAAGTVFCRFIPAWNAGDSQFHNVWSLFGGTGGQERCHLMQFSDNNIYIGWFSAATGDARVSGPSTGLFASGQWANWIVDWDAAGPSLHVYHDNTLVGSTAAAINATITPTNFVIGADGDSTALGLNFANGAIAEWARWNRVLSSGERATLESTGNPECVPDGLVHYYKILGNESPEPDEIGSEYLTVTGTPAQTTHPDVDSCTDNQTITLPLLAAAGQFFTPTVTPGTVTVTLPLLAAAGQFFAPTVISDQTITLPLLAAAGSFFPPTVSHVAPKGLTIEISDRLAPG
jgi:hypothetical protein